MKQNSNLILKPEDLEPCDFVNLHGHSTYSIGDAIGHADEIVSSAIERGMHSIAITDHGNMNVIADLYLHCKKNLWEKGVDFKPIFGMEAYFIPSLKEWRKYKTLQEEKKTLSEEEVEERKRDIIASSVYDQISGMAAAAVEDDSDEDVGAVVENEEESKKAKDWSPIKRKHHLVLLAQNETGLKNLFKLNSLAQSEGFYMKPRIDFDMLEKYNDGLVCTSSCLAGQISYSIRHADDMGLSADQTINVLENIIDRFDSIFNKDRTKPPRFYLEIQFNKIPDQHRLNAIIVELSRKTGVPLVAAADYHYPKKELFRARDMIKWVSQSKKFNIDVHSSIDELECELFPKNAQDMIDAYLSYDGNDYITRDEILTAIKNSRFIADNLIEKFEIDQGPKLPKIVPGNPQTHLEKIIAERFMKFIDAGKIPKEKADIYISRLGHELEVIRKKRFANYFIAYESITTLAKQEMLLGLGRGSGAGSLVNWLLGITELDPIRFNLLFERFLDEYRTNVYPRMDIL